MRELNFATGFRDVDRMAEPLLGVLYLEAISRLATIRSYKARTHEILCPAPGNVVLDVGCGLGEDVQVLASVVGQSGKAIGIDRSETMVAAARQRYSSIANVEFHCVRAEDLPFEAAHFDACRADRTLQHLSAPDCAVEQMFRVLKPGGRIAVSEPDYGTLMLDGGDRRVTRTILDFYADSLANGWIGRRLPALLSDAGFHDIEIDARALLFREPEIAEEVLGIKGAAARALTARLLSPEQAADWLDYIEAAQERGTFFCAVTGVVVSGRKPLGAHR